MQPAAPVGACLGNGPQTGRGLRAGPSFHAAPEDVLPDGFQVAQDGLQAVAQITHDDGAFVDAFLAELFSNQVGDSDVRFGQKRRQFALRILTPLGLACLGEAEKLCGDELAAHRHFCRLQRDFFPDDPIIPDLLMTTDIRPLLNLMA